MKFFLYGALFGCFTTALAMNKSLELPIEKTDISFGYATENDLDELLALTEQEMVKDEEKLVIVPRKFRRSSLEKAITQKRLFVARDKSTNTIVGLRKLFLVNDEEELTSILCEEIRCCGPSSTKIHAGLYSEERKHLPGDLAKDVAYSLSDTYIYSGGSFTHPLYRSKGINKALTDYAYGCIAYEVTAHILKKSSQALVLLFGLINANVGQEGGYDRTPSLLGAFMRFITGMQPIGRPVELYQYRAFKPSFDADSSECAPLPDDKSVPGYGFVFRYQLSPLAREAL